MMMMTMMIAPPPPVVILARRDGGMVKMRIVKMRMVARGGRTSGGVAAVVPIVLRRIIIRRPVPIGRVRVGSCAPRPSFERIAAVAVIFINMVAHRPSLDRGGGRTAVPIWQGAGAHHGHPHTPSPPRSALVVRPPHGTGMEDVPNDARGCVPATDARRGQVGVDAIIIGRSGSSPPPSASDTFIPHVIPFLGGVVGTMAAAVVLPSSRGGSGIVGGAAMTTAVMIGRLLPLGMIRMLTMMMRMRRLPTVSGRRIQGIVNIISTVPGGDDGIGVTWMKTGMRGGRLLCIVRDGAVLNFKKM